MFGMGMGEIILIAVVALLVLGPERLPGAAKAIGKGIRDLRAQTKDLQQTIEKDTQIGDAVRELRGALRGDPETLYKRATGEDLRDKPADAEDPKKTASTTSQETDDAVKAPKIKAATDAASDEAPAGDAPAGDAPEAKASESLFDEAYANVDDSWGEAASNPHHDGQVDPELPVIRTPAGSMPRSAADNDDDTGDDKSHG